MTNVKAHTMDSQNATLAIAVVSVQLVLSVILNPGSVTVSAVSEVRRVIAVNMDISITRVASVSILYKS